MKETGNPQYSEAIGQAGEAYDRLQEVLEQIRVLEEKHRTTMQTRLHTQNPKKLDELTQEIDRIGKQILFFDAEKEKLAARVRGLMDQHEKGQSLMDKETPKHLN